MCFLPTTALPNYVQDILEWTNAPFVYLKKMSVNVKMPNPLLKNNIIKGSISKDVRNLFRPEKLNKLTKDRVIRDIRTLLESEKEDYYIQVRTKCLY